MSGTARSCTAAEPAHLIRHRNPFLLGSSACAHRSHLRTESIVHALAEPSARGRAVANPLAPATGPSLDCKAAGGGGPQLILEGSAKEHCWSAWRLAAFRKMPQSP